MERHTNVDELAHHGVTGMRWGVRRYQNKDGTLTAAGRRRAEKMKEEYTALTGKKLIRKPTKKSNESDQNGKENVDRKSIKEMSDNEVQKRIDRLQKEKQLMGLQSETASKGEKFVSTVGKQVIAPAAIEAGKRVLTSWFEKQGKELFGLNPKETKDALKELKRETEFAELRNRKDKAEREYNKRMSKDEEKQASKDSKKDEPETVKAEFIPKDKSSKSKDSSKDRDPIIIDADWEEVSANSTALAPYRKNGESFIDDLFKKKK